MADATPPLSGPVGANLTLVLGFVVLFTTFATGSPASWIIGGLLVVAGGLWAGATGTGGATAGRAPTHLETHEEPPVAATTAAHGDDDHGH